MGGCPRIKICIKPGLGFGYAYFFDGILFALGENREC
jgi:hypothetical protein